MSREQTFVIVGAGLAGAKTAETLRAEGHDGKLVMIGDEPCRPYDRPPLSKEYLRSEKDFDGVAVHKADFYRDNDIDLRTSTVVEGIDLLGSAVVLSSGERVVYDKLLLATGVAPRQVNVPGSNLGGVYYLRNLADSDALRSAINPSTRLVVIGAGWIGAEVAASARQIGATVALVEQASLPLERVLGHEVGEIYRSLHAKHGVELHFGVAVESFIGTDTLKAVKLSDGTVLDADSAVVGVGAYPRVELAQAAGIRVDNGIVVDEYLQTSTPNVYAAGDVANAFHPRYATHIRLEHWYAALHQGPVAAANMLGKKTVYDRIPYFYSDQYDLGMEYRGWAPSYDQVVFRGDPAAGEFIAFWLSDHRVVAAMNANIWDMGDTLEALVAGGSTIGVDRLTDLNYDLS
ncbi:MAG: FAD-dependent oxidoreductase [Actinobacteria bacterium]|nr:FAD-dependent oxidoreductase [Actinomycetota bacterium]